MKQGRSIQEVLQELTRQQDTKKDYVAPARQIVLREDGSTLEIGDLEPLGTSHLFHRQIASALGIPAKYYDLMKEQQPSLLATNVNTWMGARQNSYMVRTINYGEGQTARAFLSERYRRRDNLEIASAVLPLFAGTAEYTIESSEVTSARLYMKILNRRLEAEVVPGDVVQAGVVISNSEVGLGAVSVQPLIYRLACTNGMVISDMGERRNHIGRAAKLQEDFSLYSDETLEAEDKAFLLKLKDTVLAAIEENRFSMVVDRLRVSAGIPIKGDIQEAVQVASQTFGFNSEEQGSILRYLIEGGDLSLYGLANAVTRTSQDVGSYDRATELEAAGWQIATKEWR